LHEICRSPELRTDRVAVCLSDYKLAFLTLVSGVLLNVLDRAFFSLFVFVGRILCLQGVEVWPGMALHRHGMAWHGRVCTERRKGKHGTADTAAVRGVCGFVHFSAEWWERSRQKGKLVFSADSEKRLR
jgi:hypothetical protein